MSTPQERIREERYREQVLSKRLDELVVEYRRCFPKNFDGPQIADFRRHCRITGQLGAAVELFEHAIRTSTPLSMDWGENDFDDLL